MPVGDTCNKEINRIAKLKDEADCTWDDTVGEIPLILNFTGFLICVNQLIYCCKSYILICDYWLIC